METKQTEENDAKARNIIEEQIICARCFAQDMKNVSFVPKIETFTKHRELKLKVSYSP